MSKSFVSVCAVAALSLVPVSAQEGGSSELLDYVKTNAANMAEDQIARGLRSLADNLEVTISGLEGDKPLFAILAVTPLIDDKEGGHVVFAQASLSRNDGRNTGNLGLAYRKLLADDTIILGINGFYDSEWTYDHERASIGLEALTSVGDLRFNQYWAQSDSESGKNGAAEIALDGYDIELAVPLPYLPKTKVHAKAFEYDGNGSLAEIEGEQFSLRTHLPYGFIFEGGSTSYDDATPDQDFVSLSFNLSFGKAAHLASGPLVSKSAFQLRPITDRRFEKVRRSNTITKSGSGTVRVRVSGV